MLVTAPQVELLRWIIEVAGGEAWHEMMHGGKQTIDGKNRVQRPLDPADLRELVAQDLVRHVGGVLYEVTNEGRAFYEQIKNPQKRPPVGFQPN